MVYRKKRSSGLSQWYYFDFVRKGRRFTGCTFETSKPRALQVEARKRQELDSGRALVNDVPFSLPPEMVGQGPAGARPANLADEYERLHVGQKKAQGYYSNIVRGLKLHFAATMLSEIGAREAEGFLSNLRARHRCGDTCKREGCGVGATCNRYRSVARNMWNKGQSWGFVPRGANPWTETTKGKEKPRERFLAGNEAGKLLAAAVDWLRPIVVAALHTGARRGELLGLTWRDVDFEARLLVFRDTKNGEDRTVPISETLLATLRELPSRFEEGVVFVGADGEPVNVEALRSAFKRAVASSKLAGMRFHDLRHSAASFMVQAGVPLFEVAKMLGHRDLRMTQRYAHLAPEHLRGAVAALDRIDMEDGPESPEQKAAGETRRE